MFDVEELVDCYFSYVLGNSNVFLCCYIFLMFFTKHSTWYYVIIFTYLSRYLRWAMNKKNRIKLFISAQIIHCVCVFVCLYIHWTHTKIGSVVNSEITCLFVHLSLQIFHLLLLLVHSYWRQQSSCHYEWFHKLEWLHEWLTLMIYNSIWNSMCNSVS